MTLSQLSKDQLTEFRNNIQKRYNEFLAKELKLDMSRGKPGADQIDLCEGMLGILATNDDCIEQGTDCRNYGGVDGLPGMKSIFADILGVKPAEILVGGNSSLNMMYDTIARAMFFGVLGSEKPWSKYDKIKFICPAPGYDRHFAICEALGIEMITVEMHSDGPDMDAVETLVSQDETIKGIWCVPKYSNPDGITYSDMVVDHFANLKPKAKDFRIFWDNAYIIHGFSDQDDKLKNLFDACKAAGTENMVFMYTSSSKISYPGAGVSCMAASEANLTLIKKQIGIQTIGPDKLNQLRHIRYFKDYNGVLEHMKKQAKIIAPKFGVVLKTLNKELSDKGIAEWNEPTGGYFISLNVIDGCAKRAIELAKNAGVAMTPAGSTFPYKNDPRDRNIRIAPTYPPIEELKVAIELFCICVQLAAAEKLLAAN